MERSIAFWLTGIVERMADGAAPRHRELARGMVAELAAITDPAERMRFAVGAIAALVRLALIGYGGSTMRAPNTFLGVADPNDDASLGGPSMKPLTARQLLRRHATPFAAAFATLTGILLANVAVRQVPELRARGLPAVTIVEALLLAVPHIVALTIPMAVFVAVAWVFTHLGAEGTPVVARRELHGVRRLVGPVLAVAALIGALTFVSNTLIVPRTNARLAAIHAGGPRAPSDRTMTLGELREAATTARIDAGRAGAMRAAAYEVEIHKKFALAAACVFLALAGAVIGLRFPRGGLRLVIGASGVVFTAYYMSLVAGESLADRLVIPPLVAMWSANAVLLAVVLMLVWLPARPSGAGGSESLAIGG